MLNPILLPLQSLNRYDEFVIHQDGFFMFDYYRSEILEFQEVDKDLKTFNARCFTKNRKINVSNYLPKNTLVFPIELNDEARRTHTKKRIQELEEKIRLENMANSIPLSSLNLHDRFKLNPKSTDVFIITMDYGSKYWCMSFSGGQSICKTTKVFEL